MLGSSPPSTELIYLVPRQVYFNKAPQIIQMCVSSEEPLGQEQRPQKQSAYLVRGSRVLNALLHEKETRFLGFQVFGREDTRCAWTSYQPRKQGSPQTQMGTCRKDTGTFYLEGTPNGQIGDNWSIENNNGEGLTNLFLQKKFHESTVIRKKGGEEGKCFFTEECQLIKYTRSKLRKQC